MPYCFKFLWLCNLVGYIHVKCNDTEWCRLVRKAFHLSSILLELYTFNILQQLYISIMFLTHLLKHDLRVWTLLYIVLLCCFRTGHGLFDLEYQEGDKVAFKSKFGKYVTCKGNGSLGCSSTAVGENEKFRLILENRFTIVLGCQHGFMNYKTPDSTRVQCNKATYDTFILIKAPTEGYYIKGEVLPVEVVSGTRSCLWNVKCYKVAKCKLRLLQRFGGWYYSKCHVSLWS